ncbi:hypothetical protein WJX72_008277 [[Myrmecia] bisecta]|uniref:Isochorismatase-like domain-containing protein n=1 Tax=[Myrmecia] bisecta TaxID=41462 RepID=A0AAW1P7P8_9CHLO
MAAYEPQTHLREAAIEQGKTALLYVDVQNYNCHPDGTEIRGMGPAADLAYFWDRLAEATPLWVALQKLCRSAGIELLYTTIESLTKDCRDMSLDYKISGFKVPKGSWDGQVIDALKPDANEIVLPKTSCSVFVSTNIDYVLRTLGVRCLMIAGCLTDQCVESAVRDACDLNYLVTLITDACVTMSQARHDHSLRTIKGFCRQRTTQQVEEEVAQWQSTSSGIRRSSARPAGSPVSSSGGRYGYSIPSSGGGGLGYTEPISSQDDSDMGNKEGEAESQVAT